jgi:hypothetical protein
MGLQTTESLLLQLWKKLHCAMWDFLSHWNGEALFRRDPKRLSGILLGGDIGIVWPQEETLTF